MSDILERGNIYFAYRPRVQQENAKGIEDVQRLYMILSPHGKDVYRLIVVGEKKLPELDEDRERKNWAFVDKISPRPKQVEDELEREKYRTKTRGERVRPEARPVGEGVYALARHDDHTHLAYTLELPERPREAQEELEIKEEASYVVTVKNPDAPTPPGAGLRPDGKAELPSRLKDRFDGRRFADLDPPDFLDYENTELLLIGASEDVRAELGIELDPQKETSETAEIFNDLRMERSKHPLVPLFEGVWE